MPHRPNRCLEELRIRGKILLKRLRDPDGCTAREAAERMLALGRHAGRSPDDLLSAIDRFRLKDALEVVALESGYTDWAELKADLVDPGGSGETRFYKARAGVFLNHWCRSYDEASRIHRSEGGFLLPYRDQFFVCGGDCLESLGLDPSDPDWEKIGGDWVRPRDREAWRRLNGRLPT